MTYTTLTNNPIAQNIVNRYVDYVTYPANDGILWGTNNNPTYGTYEIFVDSVFGGSTFNGSTGGIPISINGSSIVGPNGQITAASIVNTLLNETNRYTLIRTGRVRLIVTGGGGNKSAGGPIANPAGVVFDQTAVFYAHPTAIGPAGTITSSLINSLASQAGLVSGSLITKNTIESFFGLLRAQYLAIRNAVTLYDSSVCHSSCHSSCHGSRTRR